MSDFLHSFTTIDGSVYSISFSLFKADILDIDIDVFDLILKQVKDCGNNNYEVLMHLTKLVFSFLEDHDCIIYFYCDFAPIKKSKKSNHLSNQQFRSKIFTALFEKLKHQSKIEEKPFNYILRTAEIIDADNGNHYISLISNSGQGEKTSEMINSILSMNDK